MSTIDVRAIRIEAPDSEKAIALQRRLGRLRPLAIGSKAGWAVELPDFEGLLEEVEAEVRHWLREIDCAATVMSVDGSSWRVACDSEWNREEGSPCVSRTS
jgi:hypothetical protein